MSGILEITEQRRIELVNISLGIRTHNSVEQKKPLYVKIHRVREKRPKSETRACKWCDTVISGKALFCVNHRYVYQRRPHPNFHHCPACNTKIFTDAKHCAQHRTKTLRGDTMKRL